MKKCSRQSLPIAISSSTADYKEVTIHISRDFGLFASNINSICLDMFGIFKSILLRIFSNIHTP
jgi:hypothetical protein